MLGSEPDADDAIQEVFVGLVTSRHRLAQVEDLNAYLFTSLHRAVGRLLKRKQRRPTPVESLDHLRCWESTMGPRAVRHEANQVVSVREPGRTRLLPTLQAYRQTLGTPPSEWETLVDRQADTLCLLLWIICSAGPSPTVEAPPPKSEKPH